MLVYDRIRDHLTADNKLSLDVPLALFAGSNETMLLKETTNALGYRADARPSATSVSVDVDTFLACLQKKVAAYGSRWGEPAAARLFDPATANEQSSRRNIRAQRPLSARGGGGLRQQGPRAPAAAYSILSASPDVSDGSSVGAATTRTKPREPLGASSCAGGGIQFPAGASRTAAFHLKPTSTSKSSTKEPVDNYITTDLDVSSVAHEEELAHEPSRRGAAAARAGGAGGGGYPSAGGGTYSGNYRGLADRSLLLEEKRMERFAVKQGENTTTSMNAGKCRGRDADAARAHYISEFCEVMLSQPARDRYVMATEENATKPMKSGSTTSGSSRREYDHQGNKKMNREHGDNYLGSSSGATYYPSSHGSHISSKASSSRRGKGAGAPREDLQRSSGSRGASVSFSQSAPQSQSQQQNKSATANIPPGAGSGTTTVAGGRGTARPVAAEERPAAAPAPSSSSSSSSSKRPCTTSKVFTSKRISATPVKGRPRGREVRSSLDDLKFTRSSRRAKAKRLPVFATGKGARAVQPRTSPPLREADQDPEFAESFFSDYNEQRESALRDRKREHAVASSRFTHLHAGQPRRARSTDGAGCHAVTRRARPDLYYGIFGTSPERSPAKKENRPATQASGFDFAPPLRESLEECGLMEDFYQFLAEKRRTPSYRIHTPPGESSYGEQLHHSKAASSTTSSRTKHVLRGRGGAGTAGTSSKLTRSSFSSRSAGDHDPGDAGGGEVGDETSLEEEVGYSFVPGGVRSLSSRIASTGCSARDSDQPPRELYREQSTIENGLQPLVSPVEDDEVNAGRGNAGHLRVLRSSTAGGTAASSSSSPHQAVAHAMAHAEAVLDSAENEMRADEVPDNIISCGLFADSAVVAGSGSSRPAPDFGEQVGAAPPPLPAFPASLPGAGRSGLPVASEVRLPPYAFGCGERVDETLLLHTEENLNLSPHNQAVPLGHMEQPADLVPQQDQERDDGIRQASPDLEVLLQKRSCGNYLSGLSLQHGNMNSDTNILSILPETASGAVVKASPNSWELRRAGMSPAGAAGVKREFTLTRMVALSQENANSVEIPPSRSRSPAEDRSRSPEGGPRARERTKTWSTAYSGDDDATIRSRRADATLDPGEVSGLALQHSTELNFRNLLRDDHPPVSARSAPRSARQRPVSPPIFSSPRPARQTRRRKGHAMQFSKSRDWAEQLRQDDTEFRRPFRSDLLPPTRWMEFGASRTNSQADAASSRSTRRR